MKIPITKRITEIVLSHLDSSGMSEREWAEAVNISHPVIGKLRGGNAMTLTTLEKIVNRFPELLPLIGRVFDEELATSVSKDARTTAVIELELAELKRWMEDIQDRVRRIEKRITPKSGRSD